MNRNQLRTNSSRKNRWYKSPGFILFLFLHALLFWFILSLRLELILEVRPTHLILKSDSCNFLKANGVDTNIAESGYSCSVLVPFRKNLFGSGGQITLGERQISVAGDQVVVIGSVEDQPWTPDQSHAATGMIASTMVMFGILGWLVAALKGR